MLRSIVLDALAAGTPLPALKDELIAVLIRDCGPYAESYGALSALLEMGEAGKEAIVLMYREQLGSDAPAIRLRAEIISAMYGDPFGPSDVAAVLPLALACTEELPTGGLWSLPRGIPLNDIPAILDSFEHVERQPRSSRSGRRNAYNVAHFVDRLLLRVLQESDEISASELWRWLRVRRAFCESCGGRTSEDIRQALKRRGDLLLGTVDESVGALTVDEHCWQFVHHLRAVTLDAIDGDDLLERIAAHVAKAERGSDKEAFLYELALVMSYRSSPHAIGGFERLYALGDQRPDLASIRDRAIVVPIQEWQTEDALRRARNEAEQQEGMARNPRI